MDWTTQGSVTRGVGPAGVVWYITRLRHTQGDYAGREFYKLHAKGAGGGFVDAGLWPSLEAAKRFAEDEDV